MSNNVNRNTKSEHHSNNKKLIKHGKTLVFAISLIGLTYQTIQLALQYSSGQTVVNIRIEKIGFSQVPAITFCYPFFPHLGRVAELYPEFKREYDEYLDIMNKVNNTDYENKTLNKILTDFGEKGWELSLNEFNSSPVWEVFNKIGIPFSFPLRKVYQFGSEKKINLTTDIAIEAILEGIIYNESKIVNKISHIQDSNPIESISSKYGRFGPRKCFTFFSQFNNRWKDFKMNIKNMHFVVYHDKYWFPPNEELPYYFSMHSPNTLPQMESQDNYIKLRGGHSYSISYSRITTKLLPPTYTTNCRKYNINNINEEQSRSDCIDRCVLDTLRVKCGKCIHCTGTLYRKEFIEMYKCEKLCDFVDYETPECYYQLINEIQPECETNCKPDCNNQFIDFDIKEDQKMSGSRWDKQVYVSISHNRLPDQVIEHLPELTFTSFIANFGGLAGMWVGLSFIALYDHIAHFYE